jgi:hypothetical protein
MFEPQIFEYATYVGGLCVVTMISKENHRECTKHKREWMHVPEQPSVLRGGCCAHRRESTVLRVPVEELIESVYEYEDERENFE